MKKLLILLLLPLVSLAQKDSNVKPSSIRLNKLNIVYSRYSNKISFLDNNAKSFKITGKDVLKNEEGQYIIRLKSNDVKETRIFVEIIKNNGKKIKEEYIFPVKPFPSLYYSINNGSCSNECIFTKDAFKKSYIGIKTSDPNFEFSFETQSFNCKVPGFPTIECKGKYFNKRALDCIMKANRGDIIIISEVKGIYKGIEINGCIRYGALAIKIF